ncbi:hypothetical protein HMPREF0208_02666 [Citrobacter koseri]|nr:hypothetical protein HMPREF0208_02666 [Citrobacter koseri]
MRGRSRNNGTVQINGKVIFEGISQKWINTRDNIQLQASC